MKIRMGFVSNSSSSSFIVSNESLLTDKQKEQIRDPAGTMRELAEIAPGLPQKLWLNPEDAEDGRWTFEDAPEGYRGETYMDNFDMEHFFQIIGLPEGSYKVWGD